MLRNEDGKPGSVLQVKNRGEVRTAAGHASPAYTPASMSAGLGAPATASCVPEVTYHPAGLSIVPVHLFLAVLRYVCLLKPRSHPCALAAGKTDALSV